MRNLKLTEARCRGADNKFQPTICAERQQCRRFLQLELDRQLELPQEVAAEIRMLSLPRVVDGKRLDCHFIVRAA